MRSTCPYPEERIAKSLEIAGKFAAQARRRYVGMSDVEAIEGAAYYGAASALATYDERRGVKFSTWAICKVRSAILDEARQQDHIPRKKRRKYRGAEDALPGWAERPVSLEEIGFWDGDDWICSQIERAVAPWDEELPFPEADPVQEEALARCRDAAWRAWVALLPRQEREVFRLYYWHDMTCDEIGRKIGLAGGRVWQILQAGRVRLREWLGAEVAR